MSARSVGVCVCAQIHTSAYYRVKICYFLIMSISMGMVTATWYALNRLNMFFAMCDHG